MKLEWFSFNREFNYRFCCSLAYAIATALTDPYDNRLVFFSGSSIGIRFPNLWCGRGKCIFAEDLMKRSLNQRGHINVLDANDCDFSYCHFIMTEIIARSSFFHPVIFTMTKSSTIICNFPWIWRLWVHVLLAYPPQRFLSLLVFCVFGASQPSTIFYCMITFYI